MIIVKGLKVLKGERLNEFQGDQMGYSDTTGSYAEDTRVSSYDTLTGLGVLALIIGAILLLLPSVVS